MSKETKLDLKCMGIAYLANFIGIYLCLYLPLR